MYHHSRLDLKDSSRLTFHPSRKCAFTLAELLITIGIIGVVAVLTMPMLISKYNEKVIITQLQQTYAELQEAIKLSEIDNGSSRDWDYTCKNPYACHPFAEKYIMPYLSRSFKSSTVPKLYQGNYDLIRQPDGVTAHHLGSISVPYYTYKNRVIGIYPSNGGNKYASIIVDVDGRGKKNIVGKDVFLFTLFNYTYGGVEHYGLHLGNINGYHGGYRLSVDQVLKNSDCKINLRGENCGVAIQKNGWKIPKGYPIKF